MPSTSSGRIVKSFKGKRGTDHHKKHRWESFTTKIAKLNALDPLKRVRRHDLDTEDLEKTTSYFKKSLERWLELNVSGKFVDFTLEVLPLCDSLPQILHFENTIMDLLASHLEMKERESMEPLLQLLTEFAHDLGSRFEKHYSRALALVTSIVGIPQDVEVVEWSFNCLAFLFKYLSKLLVSDLRPTYDLVAPLLGKERQSPHIARFAAEAMSFLIRKAAAPAVRERALGPMILHAKLDLLRTVNSREYGLYYNGIMTMFAEAIKGNGLNVHSSGVYVIQGMFAEFDGSETKGGQNPWSDVIGGVLTSVTHHTSPETLDSVLAAVLEQSSKSQSSFAQNATPANFQILMLSSRAIGIISGVRKGSRIGNWPALLKHLSGVLDVLAKHATVVLTDCPQHQLWQSVILTAAIALQYAPIDAVIPAVSRYLDAFVKEPFASHFLSFCSYFAQMDLERFRSIVLPYFQRFVVAHWSDDDNVDTLSVLVPKFISSGAIFSNSGGKDGFSLPQSWQDQIVSKFERLEVSPFPEQAPPAAYDKGHKVWHDQCLPKYRALLEVLKCTNVHPSTNARIAEILLRKLKLALRPSSALAPDEANFIVGQGFSAFSRMTQEIKSFDMSLRPLLRAAAPRYSRLPGFLDAMLTYEVNLANFSLNDSRVMKSVPQAAKLSEDNDGLEDLFITSLVENLCTESHDLRLLSLRHLDHLYGRHGGAASEVVATMLLIEQTPLDLHSARSGSMHIRKLASLYQRLTSDLVLTKAITYFCFGMLNVKFAQIWEDARVALTQIAETSEGQDTIADLAFKWLEMPSTPGSSSPRVEQSQNTGLTDFECSNLMHLDSIAQEVQSEMQSAQSLMLSKFEVEQQQIPAQPMAARMKALQVLSGIPFIAERRSRQLVPMFLSWSRHELSLTEGFGEDGELSLSTWSRRDQKAQLELFSLFINPRVLYKSTEVYTALLGLLANGDLDIQKAALKAIFTWKATGIKPYEANLLNLLDEARFKDEIAIILQGQTLIQPDHRPEVMPVLIRLLYGRTITRKSVASGKQGMENRRLTVLRNLSNDDAGEFIALALGELKGINILDNDLGQHKIFDRAIVSVRKQVGFVNMMEDVIKELSKNVVPFTTEILSAVLYCLVFASRRLLKSVNDSSQDEDAPGQTSMLKAIRQNGFKCLILLFKNDAEFDWSSFLPIVLDELVYPRLDKLPIETAQGLSGLLQLFSTWSLSSKTVLFLGHNKLLAKIAECLSPQSSKDEVKLFALSIINNIVRIARDDTDDVEGIRSQVRLQLLDRNMDTFLKEIGDVLQAQHDINKILLEACVTTISELAPLVSGSTQARNLVDISVFLLDQPTRRVNPRIKSSLLLVLEHFVPLYDLQNDATLKSKVYHTITSLFGFFRDRPSREVLSRVLLVFSRNDAAMEEVASICADLNSFTDKKLDEPDYDRRLRAFMSARQERDEAFTAHQWTPLLYNMLFFIRRDEEFGILSSNSSDGIIYFIHCASRASSHADKAEFQDMLSSIVLPAIYSGVREPSEVIRREYVKVMADLIKTFPDWSDVKDMFGLLGGDDELEKSFFNNILTAGKGRQSSALGLLATVASTGALSSRNISHFFIPLVEHFVLDRAEGSDGHNLAAEATTTVGILARSLEWSQYKALLRRFTGYIGSRPELEKQMIKFLDKVIDALALAAISRIEMAAHKDESSQPHSMAIDSLGGNLLALAASLPQETKLCEDLESNILPPLLQYLHDKDESTVSLRVPVAIIIVRLLKILPQQNLREKLPAVLTDICHILRSKAQEARDMTRDTLTNICVLLGPEYFGFVLKELRGALARGYQLHVLSYTMHSILVATTPDYSPGDLDPFLSPIVRIIMDDIFGVIGQEKDAEEYTSKMKEVKSSKSHDSMELVAKTATMSRLIELVSPIQSLLKEKLNFKMVRKIDELLNRITTGLLRNSAANSRDALQFCYDVIQDVYKSSQPQPKSKEDYRIKRYLIQRGSSRASSRGATTVYTHKLVRFAFDVMRSILKKHDNLRTPANIAQFVPIIGDAVVQGEEEVKVAAFRLLAVIVKVSLKVTSDGTNLYKVAAAEATNTITSSTSTASDGVQSAFKLMSVILRDRRDIQIKDASVDDLLGRVKDDITDPERRHVTFNFLRAVLDSKTETAGTYDTMDYVGKVMVTNDDKDTRDLARGTYFQFLREYPQKRKRWTKQLDFIVANLKYEREGGRLSVLEVVHLLLSKSASDFVQEVSATCFVHLIFVLVNDDSEKCRMAAGELIKDIFARADKDRMQKFLDLFLRKWIEDDNPSVLRLAFLTYGFHYEVHVHDDVEDLKKIQARLLETLEGAEDSGSDWELLYAALQLISTLNNTFPSAMFSAEKATMWKRIRKCLSFPHAWVKLSSAKLMSTYFADFARANVESGLESLPLKGSQGLSLGADDVRELVWRTAGILKTPNLTEQLTTEVVKSLVFLGRCAGASDLKWTKARRPEGDMSDEEDDSLANDETTLDYLFGKLSYILRRESSPPRALVLIPKTAALQTLQILCTKLPPALLSASLGSILLPLHHLTNPSIPIPYSTDDLFKAGYEALRSGSQELMSLVQTRCGTAVYTAEFLKIREGVKARRDQRSSKRKIEAIAAPEKFGRDKKKKVERKKERRKEKGLEHRDRRSGW